VVSVLSNPTQQFSSLWGEVIVEITWLKGLPGLKAFSHVWQQTHVRTQFPEASLSAFRLCPHFLPYSCLPFLGSDPNSELSDLPDSQAHIARRQLLQPKYSVSHRFGVLHPLWSTDNGTCCSPGKEWGLWWYPSIPEVPGAWTSLWGHVRTSSSSQQPLMSNSHLNTGSRCPSTPWAAIATCFQAPRILQSQTIGSLSKWWLAMTLWDKKSAIISFLTEGSLPSQSSHCLIKSPHWI
jgi:hypothetical protein